jgi:hypothetical protein
MRISRLRSLLAVGIFLLAALPLPAQEAGTGTARLDIAVNYQRLLANPVGAGNHFWLQGGGIQLHSDVWGGLGMVTDISGLHTGAMNASGQGLDLVTTTFGARYTWADMPRRTSLYGEALVGEAFGFNSAFPSSTGTSASGNSLALEFGGGVHLPVSRRISIGALEADWVRTQLPNAASNVQNNLRLGVGVIFRLR